MPLGGLIPNSTERACDRTIRTSEADSESELHHPRLVGEAYVLDRLAVVHIAFRERVRAIVCMVEQVVGLGDPIDRSAATQSEPTQEAEIDTVQRHSRFQPATDC